MSTPPPTVGPLLASISNLPGGRNYLRDQSNELRAGLDALLHSCEAREKVYAQAATNLYDNYSAVMNEAVQFAAKVKAAAVEEANKITATAREEMQEWETEKTKLAAIHKFEPKVKLDVGGEKFTTSLTTLTRFPDCMLGAMFSGRHTLTPDQDGYHFIDRDGTHFRYILNFLRSPESFKVELTGGALSELKSECDYYGLLERMFPFVPISVLAVTNDTNLFINVSQNATGIWMYNGCPLRYCTHCGAAAYSTGTPLVIAFGGPQQYNSYIPQFLATVTSKKGIVFSEQPKPEQICRSCGRL